jgi:hydroxymethylpyrimidine/phosphomethylpyrimidine kinase
VSPVPTELVVLQIETVLADLPVVVTKTGMLATASTVAAVGTLAAAGRLPYLVVDPVLVASTGVALVEPAVAAAYLEHLVSVAAVVTPNLGEAGVLVGAELCTLADQRDAATALARCGAGLVVVKGGHGTRDSSDDAVDVVSDGETVVELRAPRVDSTNTHGTGCTFAAATAAGLACGLEPLAAVRAAKDYVHRAIVRSARWRLGAGHGPLDHLDWTSQADHPPSQSRSAPDRRSQEES